MTDVVTDEWLNLLCNKIEQLDEVHHIKILQFFVDNSDIQLNETQMGNLVNLSDISAKNPSLLLKLNDYVQTFQGDLFKVQINCE